MVRLESLTYCPKQLVAGTEKEPGRHTIQLPVG
jgi:hypothetical protein